MTSGTGTAPELLDPLVALERIDQAFYAVDHDWHFLYANAAAEAFWGMRREALLGHSMLELFPKFEGSPSHAAHVQAMAGDTPIRAEVISTATGAPVALQLYPGGGGLSVYFLDVTRRRQLELELETRDELLSLAELSAGIGVWVQDLTTATMTATPQYFQLLGIPPVEGAVSQDFVRGFRHPDDRDRHSEKFREALAAGADSFEGEYRILRPDGEQRWIFGRGRIVRDQAGKPWRYSGVDIDVTERKKQDEHLRVVMGELVHRTNNLLTVVQGLAQQTARSAETIDDFIPTFGARLQGLGQSSALLARGEWRGALLGELVRSQVLPFAGAERFEIAGPNVLLTPKAVQNLGLALHELCTNAVKYGALSVPEGQVSVAWTIPEGVLEIEWSESGGPPVRPPQRKGFGRVVSEQLLATALDARVDVAFAPAGLKWSAAIPAAEFTLQPD